MRERDFSIRTRRTTRVAIRIPVQISVRRAAGTAEIFGAWTLVVNRNGARCEGTRRLEANEEVGITNAASGKTTTAVVIWGRSNYLSGKFEFAVELREPVNLWHISFPPQDWKHADRSLPETYPASEVVLAPLEEPGPGTRRLEVRGGETAPESGLPIQWAPRDTAPQHVPLDPPGTNEISNPAECTSIPEVEADTAADTLIEELVHAAPWPVEYEGERITTAMPETDLTTDLATLLETQDPGPTSALEAPTAAEFDPKDRLTEALTELVKSALNAKIETEANRLVETHLTQLADRSQQIADEQLRRITAAGEERSRRLEQRFEAAVSDSLKDLIDRIARQMPSLEEQIIERCNSEAEQMATAALEKARHALEDHVAEISEKLTQREKATLQSVAESEQRMAATLEETVSRLEAQMTESAKVVFGSYARNLIKGINESQKDLLLQAEVKIGTASERGLREMRNGFARSLRELAEALKDGRDAESEIREAAMPPGGGWIRALDEAAEGAEQIYGEQQIR